LPSTILFPSFCGSRTKWGPRTLMEYPSVFAAVEEQLGLKLERRRESAPFDVLVIKSVGLPSEN